MTEPVEFNQDVWVSRAKLAFGLFAAVGIFFLLAEHRAHVLPFLPWLFLAACPLMHVFMHHGHHGHDHHAGKGGSAEPPNASSVPGSIEPGGAPKEEHGVHS